VKLERESWETNGDFLFKIYNKFGYEELTIAANQFVDGELCWSKRFMYKDLKEIDMDRWVKRSYDIIKGVPHTRRELIAAASHRTIMDIEIMIDVDDTKHDIFEFKTIKEKAQFIAYCLRAKGKDISIYFTGNKSYHISYIEPMMRGMTPSQRRYYRESILMPYFADLQLSSDKSTISLEGARHYRSGRIKRGAIL